MAKSLKYFENHVKFFYQFVILGPFLRFLRLGVFAVLELDNQKASALFYALVYFSNFLALCLFWIENFYTEFDSKTSAKIN